MANVTPGYTFTEGETNVTHTKLNAAAAGTVNASLIDDATLADPAAATSYMLMSTGGTFKKTLVKNAIDKLILAGSEKTVPVYGDKIPMGDSADSYAIKFATLGNLLFGGATVTALVGADLLPIYDASGAATGVSTLYGLTGGLESCATVAGTITGVEQVMLAITSGSAVKKATLAQMTSALAVSSAPVAGDQIQALSGGVLKSNTFASFFAAPAKASPAGTELALVSDGGTLASVTLANVAALASIPRKFESSDYAIPTATGAIISDGVEHGLGAAPSIVWAKLITQSGEETHGYATGEIVDIMALFYGWNADSATNVISPKITQSADLVKIYASVYWFADRPHFLVSKSGTPIEVSLANVATWFKLQFFAARFL